MAPLVHDFDWPDRFVVGTVGPPGARTFYLQARTGGQLVSIAMEKEQSLALADKIEEVLDELMAQDGNPHSIPALAPDGLVDTEPLDEPLTEQFRAGAISLGWDPATAQVVIEVFPPLEVEVDPEAFARGEIEIELDSAADPGEILRVRIPVGAARAFTKRTRQVASSGRPICPLCDVPMDSDDHICTLPEGFR